MEINMDLQRAEANKMERKGNNVEEHKKAMDKTDKTQAALTKKDDLLNGGSI
ncbi:hypothetical protein TSUD_161840 [Trifolium subterraneum]|uniref:Uncharacterized protein n=1 Tax=Trifolium subterraneum TaxID=3900 RepID=A0A2Z6NDK7_TRISU|nr:hypothetical protein TSUD_161840 [Trifolium subterraneum]